MTTREELWKEVYLMALTAKGMYGYSKFTDKQAVEKANNAVDEFDKKFKINLETKVEKKK